MARGIELADFLSPPSYDDRRDLQMRRFGAYKRWFAALGNREFQAASLLFLGDSWTEGGFVSSHARKWTTLVGKALQTPYRPGGGPWISTNEYLTTWVNSGMTPVTTTFGVGYLAQLSGVGTGFSEITVQTDRFWIIFTGATTSGSATISVDSVDIGTINTIATSNYQLKKFDSGPITWGRHVVRVRPTVGSQIIVDGIYAFDQDYSKGVQIWPVGHSGLTSENFNLTTVNSDHWQIFAPDFAAPDHVVIQLGGNDFFTGRTPAQMATSLEGIVAKINTMATPDPSITLMCPWSPANGSNTDEMWLPYRKAMRDLTDRNDWGWIDMHDLQAWAGAVGDMSVKDLVVTNGSNLVTSANEAFFRDGIDEPPAQTVGIESVGNSIITGGRTITAIAGGQTTQATISGAPLVVAPSPQTITAILSNRKDPDLLSTDLIHPSDRGAQWIADEFGIKLGGLPRIASIPQGIFNRPGEMLVAESADVAKAVRGVLYQTSDVVNSSTTVFTNLPDLSWTISPNETQRFFFMLIYTSAAVTTGMRFLLNATAFSPAPAFQGAMLGPAGVGAVVYSGNTGMAGQFVSTGSNGATPVVAFLAGFVTAGTAGGTFTPQLGSEIGSSAVTLKRGSWGLIL